MRRRVAHVLPVRAPFIVLHAPLATVAGLTSHLDELFVVAPVQPHTVQEVCLVVTLPVVFLLLSFLAWRLF